MFQPVAHFSLYPFNTFGMDVHASWFDILSKEEDLLHLKEQDAFRDGLLILGGGSNILFTQDVPLCVAARRCRRGVAWICIVLC